MCVIHDDDNLFICFYQGKCLKLTIWCSWCMALGLYVTCALEALLNVVSASPILFCRRLWVLIEGSLLFIFMIVPGCVLVAGGSKWRFLWLVGSINLLLLHKILDSEELEGIMVVISPFWPAAAWLRTCSSVEPLCAELLHRESLRSCLRTSDS